MITEKNKNREKVESQEFSSLASFVNTNLVRLVEKQTEVCKQDP